MLITICLSHDYHSKQTLVQKSISLQSVTENNRLEIHVANLLHVEAIRKSISGVKQQQPKRVSGCIVVVKEKYKNNNLFAICWRLILTACFNYSNNAA